MRTWLDPFFAIPTRSPFPIGKSPFRQRGHVYQRNLEFWCSSTPGGLPALCAQVGDPALDRFLAQRFETSELYDALPSALVSAAGARLRRIPIYQHLRELGAFQAERAYGGFSGVLLRVLSTETVATWIPRISAAYHAFGSVETEVAGARTVRGVRRGMPRMYVQVWGVTAIEVVEGILARSGAASPRCLVMEPEPDGAVEGHEVFRIPFEVRWGTSGSRWRDDEPTTTLYPRKATRGKRVADHVAVCIAKGHPAGPWSPFRKRLRTSESGHHRRT